MAVSSFGSDKLLFESRDTLVGILGEPTEHIQRGRAALAKMVVERFRRDAWDFVVYFDSDHSHRVIISKQDGTKLTDQEIGRFLVPNKSYNNWSEWKDAKPARVGE